MEPLCLLDYISNPRELETTNRMYTASAIYSVKPDKAIVELEYNYSNDRSDPVKILHEYNYDGTPKNKNFRSILTLNLKTEELPPRHTALSCIYEGEHYNNLSAFLWLGE